MNRGGDLALIASVVLSFWAFVALLVLMAEWFA